MASKSSDPSSSVGKSTSHFKPLIADEEEGAEDSQQSQSGNSEDADDAHQTYFFESDHVALKGNSDYHALLKTVAVLEAQRVRAIQDLDMLIDAQQDALAQPIQFVDKLQRQVNLGLPGRQSIAELPRINWQKYTSATDPMALNRHKHMTRHKKGAADGGGSGQSSRAASPSSTNQPSSDEVVRGRIKSEHKPATFNQLWSIDEQKKLEELLVKFPPEEVEARRWDKIAKALGNRTTQQVASRVQKYFIKLAKSGLAIPGRMPNMNQLKLKGGLHKHQRFNRFYFQPSTFLTSYHPPVYMSEDDDGFYSGGMDEGDPLQNTSIYGEEENVSDDEDVPAFMRESAEYQELLYLKRLRQRRLREQGASQHLGYKCDRCDCEPITGTRWHCMDCNQDDGVDFCNNCYDCKFETGSHTANHRLEPITLQSAPRGHVDQDYTRFMTGDYNYLDPNYMPAS